MERGSGTPRARRTLAFLRGKIASGEWPVNSKIPTEPELMEMLGVGKTTVREAVRSLASMGILETMPSLGTFVRSRMPVSSVLADYIAEFDLAEILGFRRALEVEAARQAALHRTAAHLEALRVAVARSRATDVDYPSRWELGRTPGQFHHLVFDAAANQLLTGVYVGVMTALRRAIDSGTAVYGAGAEARNEDHGGILAAIEDGDADAAAGAMARHVDRDLVPGGATGRPEPLRESLVQGLGRDG
ncbi:FadR/GntR family transcriptional regulator [Propionicicella superfundia]|uniref:FadR/GntR family transcriptional regulator n=1 Tax=Propionicicella superfundia TaxID=348582 RepID=UPI0004007885|nr:FCD domain-containing protein [Propionicicella superfundia]